MSERLTKRQLKHDQFLDLVQEGAIFARKHALIVGGGVVVFVAAVALAVRVGGWAAGPRPDNSEADRALSEARTEFAFGRVDAGREGLERVRTTHKGSRASREATYILANAYFETGDWTKAAETFRAFLEKPLYDDMLQDGARLGLAACKEESGDVAGAFEDYRKLWTDATRPGARIEAALSAGRCARTLGRNDDARQVYQALVDAYPTGTSADEARFQLLALSAQS